ncbi:MAG TPA: ComEC/Rec2 family competence protein [Bryobacteraceae bacterium]|nr:ComEC/Rec2 family competence protein [Bryobacteraceae bacterium]
MRFREPLLLPFFAISAGITIGLLSKGPLQFSVLNLLAAAATLGSLAFIAYVFSFRAVMLAAAMASLLFGGIALVASRPAPEPPVLSVPDNRLAIFTGCVVDPALLAVDRERFIVELAPGARAQVSLFARADQEFPNLPYGTNVEFRGKVRRSHNYNDPGAFDAVHFLARQRIYWTASADAATLRTLPGRCGNRFSAVIFGIRSAALDRLDRLYANDAYSNGMMQAILIGATAKLDRMWTEDYRSTGTFHALVISGTHVAVLAAVLLFFLRICAVPAPVALFLTIVAAWLYAGVTGWQAPVLRSAAGMTLYGIARCFYRQGRLLNILAAVALFFLVADPEQLFDASFQLSFLAVAVIGAFVVPVLEATSAPLARGLSQLADDKKDVRLLPATAQFRVEMRLLARTLVLVFSLPARAARVFVVVTARVTLYVYEIFITSLFIQIGLALPMVIYFHRLSASGLSANAIVVPVLGAIVPLGFLAIAMNSLTLAHFCAWLLNVARLAVALHARWEPEWRIPAPPLWLAAAFAVALLIAALRGRRPWSRPVAWIAGCAALAVIVIHPFAPVIERGKFELDVIDVGQGDSLLTVFPNGQTMLIDTGGIPSFGRARKAGLDMGEDVVSPYLWSRSMMHLDVVVMTHAHEDHMGGMGAVLRNFHPRELWVGATPDSPEWRSVRDTAERLHIPIVHREQGAPFQFGNSVIEVLAPLPDYEPDATPKNNDSLVMRIRFGGTSFLLTGDMEKKIEERLYVDGRLQHDDVLKVGHHGSRTSSTPDLLDAERPAFGIVSAGFDNTYGHPHPAVLAALKERNVTLMRTDEDGLVTVVSDGRRLRITKAMP